MVFNATLSRLAKRSGDPPNGPGVGGPISCILRINGGPGFQKRIILDRVRLGWHFGVCESNQVEIIPKIGNWAKLTSLSSVTMVV